MIRWIQNKTWIPEAALAILILLLGGIADFLLQSWQGLLTATLFAVSAVFIRRHEYLALALTALAGVASVLFSLSPTISGILTVLTVFFGAAFAKHSWSLYYAAVTVVVAIAVVAHTCFDSLLLSDIYGLAIFSDAGRWTAFFILSLSAILILGMSWISGSWLISQYKERKLQRERTALDEKQVRLAIDIAEQNERMGIARDLNLVSTQQLSASIAMVEGARYAAKLDSSVALRTLERLENMLRETHTELQQQQDALSHGVSIAPAPPNIFDLDALMVQYRELGYNCTLTHQGEIKALIDSAELSIYRIVFDALGNIRKHAPVGTSVTVDLTWQANGLQLLIKDNGTETARKQTSDEIAGTYNVTDDIQALTAEVDGVGIRTMRERAELIGGSLEAKTVPGVGFTINALFPDLSQVTKA